MKVNVVTYYVANKWGSMVEREKLYGTTLSQSEVRAKAEKFLDRLRMNGTQVYPKFDLVQEVR